MHERLKKYLFALVPLIVISGAFYFYLGDDFTYFQDDESYLRSILLFNWPESFNGTLNSYFPFGYSLILAIIKFFCPSLSVITLSKIVGYLGILITVYLVFLYFRYKTSNYYSIISCCLIFMSSSWFLHIYGGVNSEQVYFPLYFLLFLIAVRKNGHIGYIWSFCFGLLTLLRYMHIAFLPLIFVTSGDLRKRASLFLVAIIPALIHNLVLFFNDSPARELLDPDYQNVYPALFQSLYGFFDIWGEGFYFIHYQTIVIFYVFLLLFVFIVYRGVKIDFEKKWVISSLFIFFGLIIFTNQFLDRGVHFGVRLLLFLLLICLPVLLKDLYQFRKARYLMISAFVVIAGLNFFSYRTDLTSHLFIKKWLISDKEKRFLSNLDGPFIISNHFGLVKDITKLESSGLFLRRRFTSLEHFSREGIEYLPETIKGVFFYRKDGLDQFELFNYLSSLDSCDVRYPYRSRILNEGTDLYRIVVEFYVDKNKKLEHQACLNKKAL